LKAVELENI